MLEHVGRLRVFLTVATRTPERIRGSRLSRGLLVPSVKGLLLACVVFAAVSAPPAADAATVDSNQSGNWSDPLTWVNQRVPEAGDAVRIHAGHTVRYDTASSDVIASILINGILTFAPDQNTRL